MRILIVTRDFPPYHGGVAQVAYGLADALHGMGHDIEVHCTYRPGLSPPPHEFPFPLSYVAERPGRAGEHATFGRALADYRRRGGLPDRVIAVHWKAVRGTSGRLRRWGVPLHLVLHALEITEPTPWLKRLVKRRVFRRADQVVSVSRFTADEVVRRFGVPAERVHVIHPGVDLDVYRPGEPAEGFRERYGIAKNKVLATVARVIERKGHDMVVRAMPRVLERHPDAQYVICGREFEPFATALRAEVDDLGLNDVVRFLGHVPAEDVPEVHRACTLSVMPSRVIADRGDTEGFGITYLEAGACGKPVIGGDQAGVVDAIVHEETGLLVNPNDPDAVADAILRLLDDPDEAQAFGRAGLRRARETFGWTAIARQYLELGRNGSVRSGKRSRRSGRA